MFVKYLACVVKGRATFGLWSPLQKLHKKTLNNVVHEKKTKKEEEKRTAQKRDR